MGLQEAEARHLQHLSLFRRTMFLVIAILTILSLLSVPLREAMVRDMWQEEPQVEATPWVYSIVAVWEVVHLSLMLYAWFAVLRSSAWRSLVTSLLSILLAIGFLVALICVGSYGLLAGSIVAYVVLALLFALFGQYVMYEELPIDFVVRTRDGKTSPLLA